MFVLELAEKESKLTWLVSENGGNKSLVGQSGHYRTYRSSSRSRGKEYAWYYVVLWWFEQEVFDIVRCEHDS